MHSVSEYYSESLKGPHECFAVDDYTTVVGDRLARVELRYKTHGRLSQARDNAVLVPHMYSGTSSSVESLVAPGRALDPADWFVICPGQLGNGFSTSPAHVDGPFPRLAIADDAVLQQRLVREHLGVERLALAVGFSMGAQQVYEWATRVPEAVARIVPVAGTAQTTPRGRLWCGLARDALRLGGLDLHARVMAATALAPDTLTTQPYRRFGLDTFDDFLRIVFLDDFAPQDPANLTVMLDKWEAADAGDLSLITAATTAVAFSSDPLFPPSDIRAEVARIPGGRVVELATDLGHYAWEAGDAEKDALDMILREALSR